jgi:hypothetical protein
MVQINGSKQGEGRSRTTKSLDRITRALVGPDAGPFVGVLVTGARDGPLVGPDVGEW